ncbi:nucleotide-binding protein [Curtobacterium sp. MCBD17_026]|uniref:TIR domain-containing protein n=1 Tax=Curtobacterium sp. MCBD17_026 TaxID=2175621 RepID=UPI0015E8CFBC|nr:nucleotide-binding protein [Curtobacterium sp. MCBD17_026]WIB72525.1 nucleotide-binding protein [Curtobacterium sp. MCBD17_026]
MSRSDKTALPSVFIGSSSEGLEIARHLQADLENTGLCTVIRWDQGVFHASSYTIPRLAQEASEADFAVLIATADDIVQSRGVERAAARDNIYFELGLFIGTLGLDRTYLLSASRSLQLPSDLQGLTWLPYRARDDQNTRAAVNDATIGITARIRTLGRRSAPAATSLSSGMGHREALITEIARICSDAEAQGWLVKTNTETVLRLRSPRGQTLAFTLGEPAQSRNELRDFASQLRTHGLRVSRSVRRPVSESPIPV